MVVLDYVTSAATAPGTFDADINQLIREHIREILTISLRPNYSHYTTAAAALYAALVRDFGDFGPEQLYPKVCALVDAVCTADTDIATWLGTMGSLARDLTAMELTVEKLLCALYLRGLPPRFDSFVNSILSATSNLSDSKLTSDRLRAAILKHDTIGISGSKRHRDSGRGGLLH
ncbi:hypothetical protein C366_03455 [Cryptococcus neoformans Tu401-1]|nr:hypothetical protein C366_03455 [Cryptococcus neoformans var. grubii Tu401-1]